MLKASLGSPCFCPSGSRDSPAIFTQPRLMPPALAEWIANSDLCSSVLLKKSFDYSLSGNEVTHE